MKYYVVSDVHSYFDELQTALKDQAFQPETDTLILVGDAFDRGTQPVELFTWLTSLPHLIHILGNHDAMTYEFLKNPYHEKVEFDCYNNGNNITLAKFASLSLEEFDKKIKEHPEDIQQSILKNHPTLFSYLNELPYYYEDEKYIFVHSGFSLTLPNWHDSSFHEFCWNRPFFWEENNLKKHIFLGHTPTNKLRRHAKELGLDVEINNEPFTYQNKTALDGGICYPGGKLNILVLEHEKSG